jgi:hypothetical protein
MSGDQIRIIRTGRAADAGDGADVYRRAVLAGGNKTTNEPSSLFPILQGASGLILHVQVAYADQVSTGSYQAPTQYAELFRGGWLNPQNEVPFFDMALELPSLIGT